jgi:hypothetical protein
MALVPVSRETLGKMRMKPVPSFAFAANSGLVRVLAGEAGQIAMNYPIVFVSENDVILPFAMLGLSRGENLFIDDDGRWLGLYIPAILRRFPFFMGKSTNAEGKDNNLMLLVEDAYLSEVEGEPLFGPDEGEPKGPVARAVQFLTEITIQDARTTAITKSMAENQLFEPLPLQVTRGTEAPVNLTGILVISEAKLNALPDDKFLEFRRSGALMLAYAHLISLGQFSRLRSLASAKLLKAPPTAA